MSMNYEAFLENTQINWNMSREWPNRQESEEPNISFQSMKVLPKYSLTHFSSMLHF